MTPQQIADDLRPRLRGRLAVDDMTRRLYSTDASPFQIFPSAVAVPADEADVITCVKFAQEKGVPIVPRGGGTGLAGEALTAGLVLDLSVHFRKIIDIEGDLVRVQPGVTLRELNDALAEYGRRFAPDPANAETATLGGMIATNASGGTAFRHGYTRDHVQRLRVVWDSGDVEEVQSSMFKVQNEEESARGKSLRELVDANLEIVDTAKPKFPFSRCGYALGGELASLLVGSEGTLAITTEATLRTIPIIGGTAQFALGFATLDEALIAGLALRTMDGVAGCDLLDQRLLTLARKAKDVLAVPADTTAALVVTVEAGTEQEVMALATVAFDVIRLGATVLAEPVAEPEGRQRIARFREAGVYGFYALSGGKRPDAFVEDLGVPPEALPAFLHQAQQILRDADFTASFLTHVLTGTVHCRPLIDFADPADQAKAWPLANALFELALTHGGTISAQHGVGLARTPWIEKQFGPALDLFRELKRIFDPKNILNPGKIVGPDPSRPAWPFRGAGIGLQAAGIGKNSSDANLLRGSEAANGHPADTRHPIPDTRYPMSLFDEDSFRSEIRKCNTCGDCRSRVSPLRMCPMFRATGNEAATPRGMANALHAALEAPGQLSADDIHVVAKHCIQCQQCRDECKAGIDIPHLMLEARAAHFAAHGYDRGDWLMTRSERLTTLAGTFAFTANTLLSMKSTRWLMEKLFGLSRKRMIHRYTHRTYLRKRLVQRLFRRPPAGARKIAYFLDNFANFNDPLIAEATVAVLEHHGFAVTVPQRQRGSGMPALHAGDVATARARAAYNVRTLAELVRDDHIVVCSEPTAALALKIEYPRLLDSDDARLVADRTVELTALLSELQSQGELKPPAKDLDLSLGHHAPCHLKSLGPVTTPALLSSIPKLRVHAIDAGCSGAAGVWGFARANFDASMAIGAPVFAALDRPRVQYGVTECGTCRMQIQQGAGKRVFHPVQLLAYAYGLLPALEARLTRPLKPRLTG